MAGAEVRNLLEMAGEPVMMAEERGDCLTSGPLPNRISDLKQNHRVKNHKGIVRVLKEDFGWSLKVFDFSKSFAVTKIAVATKSC